jgi:hypothetical protein
MYLGTKKTVYSTTLTSSTVFNNLTPAGLRNAVLPCKTPLFTLDRFGDYDVYNPYDLDNYGIVIQ